MARNRLDNDNHEMINILESLLSENTEISAREVARRHSGFVSASSVTRDSKRMELVQSYKQRQVDLRNWHQRVNKNSKADYSSQLERLQTRNSELERNEVILLQGYVSLISIVAELGGIEKLADYYCRFSELRDSLTKLNAMSD